MQILINNKQNDYLKSILSDYQNIIEVIENQNDKIVLKVTEDNSILICDSIMFDLQSRGLLQEDSISSDTLFIESIFDIFNEAE